MTSYIDGAFVPLPTAALRASSSSSPSASPPPPPRDEAGKHHHQLHHHERKEFLRETRFPATNEVTSTYYEAGEKEVDDAVRSALRALPEWQRRTPAERGRVLWKAAKLLRARNNEIATLETLNTGRVIRETKIVDVVSASECFEYFGGSLSVQSAGEAHPLQNDSFVYTRREPLGVCVGIGAFNYPLQSAAWKAAPALAFGNALLFKPAEDTPFSALVLAECLSLAGGFFSSFLTFE